MFEYNFDREMGFHSKNFMVFLAGIGIGLMPKVRRDTANYETLLKGRIMLTQQFSSLKKISFIS